MKCLICEKEIDKDTEAGLLLKSEDVENFIHTSCLFEEYNKRGELIQKCFKIMEMSGLLLSKDNSLISQALFQEINILIRNKF